MQRIIMYISIAALTIDIIYVDGPSGTKKIGKKEFHWGKHLCLFFAYKLY